ncbi:hypothetical protein D3C80_2041240 [compost metagenome]
MFFSILFAVFDAKILYGKFGFLKGGAFLGQDKIGPSGVILIHVMWSAGKFWVSVPKPRIIGN